MFLKKFHRVTLRIFKEKMGTSTIHYASLTEGLGGKNGVHKCVSGKVGVWLL